MTTNSYPNPQLTGAGLGFGGLSGSKFITGIGFTQGSVASSSIEDDSSAVRSIAILGTHTYGIVTAPGTGNVGIGILNPTFPFEVLGTGALPIAQGSGAQTNGIARFQSTNASTMLDIGTSDNKAPYGVWLQSHNVGNAGVIPLLLNPTGGNVGIGTTTPGATFGVQGNALISGNLIAAQATTTTFAITGIPSTLLKTDPLGDIIPAVAGVDYATPGASAFEFTPGTFGSTNENSTSTLIGCINGIYALASSTIGNGTQGGGLTISGGATTTGNAYFVGNVGIGTTSVSALLTIDSTSTTGTILGISNGSTGGHVYDFLETGSANSGGAGRLDFFDKTAGAARLSIAANGNVGVGTTSPFTNFTVNGSGYFTGNLITTGTLSGLTVSGQGNGLYSVPVTLGATLHTFGDSITYGTGATSRTVDYVSLLSADMNAGLTDYGISGEQACDMGDSEVFPNENPASTTRNMIYTVMIGTNDAEVKGVGSYESVFNTCEQAEIAWLAIPSQYKVFGQSSGNTTTGTWANDNTYQTGIGIQSTTNGSTLAVPITTTGGPVYIWYRIQDGNAGTFTYNIDGGSNVSANAFTSPAIATQNGGTRSVALARITGVSAGTHTINFTVTS